MSKNNNKNKHNYKFFQNKNCEFFPCHKIAKEEDFNCLFCFCPLYALGDKCGGDFEYLENGIKDCSSCTLPHIKDNYQLIVDRTSILVDKVRINDPNYKINTVLIATQNLNKLVEYKKIFKNLKYINWKTIKDFPEIKEPEEIHKTFQDNALLKAKYYSRKTGLPVISDDSGLCIDGLDNFPGVNSKRWLQEHDYNYKNQKLIELVNEKTNKFRKAKYVCVIAFSDEKINFSKLFFGECRGHIAKKISGNNGFGYDPIFVLDKYKKTMAELSPEIKNIKSHRAVASLGFASWVSFFTT